jgi:nitrite reductase/ring-hydroxylating ferredoxin subunit
MIAAPQLTSEYVDVCGERELWDGEMDAFDVGDHEVLVVRLGGQYRAYDGICPHQSVSLVEGELTEEGILICKAHHWRFDASCGKGVNPATQCLRRFPIKVEAGRVLVGLEPEPRE